MALGTTVGIQTGSEHVAAKQYHAVVYATVASILNGIILPDSRMESRTVVVIDEAHANSLEMQVTLAAIRVAARRVPLSKLPVFVIQSASLDLPRMSRYFNTQHCY
jgi:HrpA-like RNA helicase